MILITGATGNFGSKAIDHLLNKGVPATKIIALARDGENATGLKEKGISVRIGDYSNIDSMLKAFEGVDKLLLISSSDRGAVENRTKHHINAITAAKNANVNHLVYTSFVRKSNDENSAIADFQNSHLDSENFLKQSGIDYTILQNGIYQEMISAFVGDQVSQTRTILFPAAEGKASWVLREDLAEAASNILTSGGHINKTYMLTNNTSVGFNEIAKYISAILNEDVQYISPDNESFRSTLKNSGAPEMYIGMFLMWGEALAEGIMDVEDKTLESLLGRKPTSVKAFIDRIYG